MRSARGLRTQKMSPYLISRKARCEDELLAAEAEFSACEDEFLAWPPSAPAPRAPPAATPLASHQPPWWFSARCSPYHRPSRLLASAGARVSVHNLLSSHAAASSRSAWRRSLTITNLTESCKTQLDKVLLSVDISTLSNGISFVRLE